MAIIKIGNPAIDLDAAEIPNLDTAKITTGQFTDSRIADVAATKITGTITPSDSTVSLAKLTATGTKDATTFLRGDNTFNAPPLGGITEADQWRVTVDFNLSTTATDITANLERNDTDFGLIGDGMTQSSGVFTFPSTGIYMVKTFANMNVGGAGGSRYHKIMILTTTDNSSYNIRASGSSTTSIADGQSPVYCELIFDVTNTSLCKVKFQTQKYSASYNTAFGVSTNANFNAFTFIRLGDT